MLAEWRQELQRFRKRDEWHKGSIGALISFHAQRGRLSWRIFSPTIPGALALALSALFGVWILYLRPAAAPYAVEAPAAAPAVALASNPYGGLFDPRSSSGYTPVSLAQSFPLKSTFESILPAPAAAIAEPENVLPMPRRAVPQIAEIAPLPIPRPAELGLPASHSPAPAGRRLAQQNRRTALPTTPADNRTFFQKLFGMPQPSGSVVAYAAPEGGVLGNARSLTSARRPATIDGRPFMMLRRILSTCPMERDWKRIRALATGWTIRVTSTNECAGRHRRTSMSLSRGSSFSTESKHCASSPLAAVTSIGGRAFSHTPTC